jgi:hypothetical protein
VFESGVLPVVKAFCLVRVLLFYRSGLQPNFLFLMPETQGKHGLAECQQTAIPARRMFGLVEKH